MAAYRVAQAGESGAVSVSTVPTSSFWGVPVGEVDTASDGAFEVKGLGSGLHVIMLTEEPRRGGCVGQAGMLRFVRLNPSIPPPPITLGY